MFKSIIIVAVACSLVLVASGAPVNEKTEVEDAMKNALQEGLSKFGNGIATRWRGQEVPLQESMRRAFQRGIATFGHGGEPTTSQQNSRSEQVVSKKEVPLDESMKNAFQRGISRFGHGTE